jgi:hypothetical protein
MVALFRAKVDVLEYAPRHIRHAIMGNAVYHVNGVAVFGGAGRFRATAWSMATSIRTEPGFMSLRCSRVMSFGATAPGISTALTTDIRFFQAGFKVDHVAEKRVEVCHHNT